MKVDLSGGNETEVHVELGEEFQVAPRSRNGVRQVNTIDRLNFVPFCLFFSFCAQNSTFGIHLTIYIPCRHIT